MVRVGVDENVADELLADFPPEATIVRLGRAIPKPVDVDFWILPFYRKDAQKAFPQLRGLKVAQSLMAGVDWILPWLPPNVTLCDGRGIHDISASEWVLAAILATMKRIPLYRDLQAKHQWKGFATVTDGFLAEPGVARGQYTILAEDLAGKTVLIVGYGSIGAAIESRLTPFGVAVLRVARTPRTDPLVSPVSALDALLPEADIVVLIVPLTDDSRNVRRRADAANETRSIAGECSSRSSGGSRCAGAGARGEENPRGRGRHRSRAAAGRSSAVERAKLPDHTPHRWLDA
jgi:phosphoglycerate dehydrogenase-like enzyme